MSRDNAPAAADHLLWLVQDWGTASMISAAPDTGHFLQALFDGRGRLLTDASVARMTDFEEDFEEADGDVKNPPFIEVHLHFCCCDCAQLFWPHTE